MPTTVMDIDNVDGKELENPPTNNDNNTNTNNTNNKEKKKPKSKPKPKPQPQQPQKAVKKSRKRKFCETIPVSKTTTTTSSSSSKVSVSLSPSEPAKKKRKKGWSPSEEKLYVEALSLYGRDWKSVASHVGNGRNAASIRSHTQVYLMKLLSKKEKLPTKFYETGNGYTLGGKPLNKYSSIAVRHFGCANNVPMIDGVISDEEAANKLKKKYKNGKNGKNGNITGNKTKNNKNNKKARGKKKKKKKNKFYDNDSDSECDFSEFNITVSSSRKRSERTRASRNRNKNCINYNALHETDPFGLRTDIEYYDRFIPINMDDKSSKKKVRQKFSSSSTPQPFDIVYCPNGLLIADIHSHLCCSVEIMGLLGGTYDSDRRILYIKKCYPLNEEHQGEQEVSADCSDHLRVAGVIRNDDNLEVVGWYHSHPCFDNYPSNTDCQQHYIHKYDNELNQPYIGLIISSWSSECVSGKSDYRFFNSIKEINDVYTPFQFYTKQQICKEYNNINDDNLIKQINKLINKYTNNKYDIYRTNFGELWDPNDDHHDNNNNNNNANTMSKGDKILQSVKHHLIHDNDDEIKVFLNKINKIFVDNRDIWWITNKPVASQQINDNDNNDNKTIDDDNIKENKNTLNDI